MEAVLINKDSILLVSSLIAIVLIMITAYTVDAATNTTAVNSSKANTSAVLDNIGQQEAQFGDVQHVTYNDTDDASVIDNYGYGDCWADSAWLYNKLSAAGIQARIMGYEDRGIGNGYRHTWVEINVGNGWEMWNYTQYNSQHVGYEGFGTPFVLIGPGNAPANIISTGY